MKTLILPLERMHSIVAYGCNWAVIPAKPMKEFYPDSIYEVSVFAQELLLHYHIYTTVTYGKRVPPHNS